MKKDNYGAKTNAKHGKIFILLVTEYGNLLAREQFDTAAEAEAEGYAYYFCHEGRDVYVKPAPNGNNEQFALIGAPFAPETASTRLTIIYPMSGLKPQNIANLRKMVLAKEVLLKKALGAKNLPIRTKSDTLCFPWFPAESAENAEHYAHLIYNLVETAREKRWVLAKPQKSFPNEKYALQIWQDGLGLVGQEYAEIRRLLRANLSGDSGRRYVKPRKFAKA